MSVSTSKGICHAGKIALSAAVMTYFNGQPGSLHYSGFLDKNPVRFFHWFMDDCRNDDGFVHHVNLQK